MLASVHDEARVFSRRRQRKDHAVLCVISVNRFKMLIEIFAPQAGLFVEEELLQL